MVGHARALAETLVVGANHRSSALAVRDRLFVDEAAAPQVLAALRAAGVDQALVLSTCDRVEVIAAHADTDAAVRAIRHTLAAHADLPPDDLDAHLYTHVNAEAVRHVFGVAASLDSQLVGEPFVLGQVKDGHAVARSAGMIGSELETVLQAAYGAAKRVRSETGIGRHAVSMATAAAERARALHGDLSTCAALLIGTGEMGELVMEALHADRLTERAVTHPVAARAERSAARLGCHATPFAELAPALAAADVVVTALGARVATVSADLVRSALKRRRNRPMLVVDLAVPGDVDAAVDRLDEAFLYSLDDLERIALEGQAHRESAARDAWHIVDEMLAAFVRSSAERTATPVVDALRHHFEDVRRQVLADAGRDPDKATRLLIHRLLHEPTQALKELAAAERSNSGDLRRAERLLRSLFRLAPAAEPEKKDNGT